MSIKRTHTVLFAVLLVLGSLGATAFSGLATHPATQDEGVMTVQSFDNTLIEVLVCKPDTASDTSPVPIILHSHGWGGSRADDCSSFDDELAAGFGVVSISQRGFGNSTGQAHVHDPDYEGQDNIAVIDHVAGLPWVALDGPGDPVMGAIGGSYGGGYQFITALTEVQETGDTRFDALAPEITWHDLVQSLAPNGVVRSVWVDALYAAGAGSVHQGIHEAFFYAALTGQLPDGSVPGVYNVVDDFAGNSPKGFSDQGIQLDIPVLIGQGITDNLFNLNEGWHNFEDVLTPAARAQSAFIGYNDGHSLPSVMPMGGPGSVADPADPCTTALGYASFSDLALDFFRAHLQGVNVNTPAGYHLATADNQDCLSVSSLASTDTAAIGHPVATPTGAGGPLYVPVLSGPTTLAGIPTLEATMTSAGLDARAFLGLAVGTTPADAQLLSNNLMPVQRLTPALQEPLETELAGISVDMDDGETLYLVVTPVADQFIHHGSRAPGALVFQDAVLNLPVVT